MTDNFNINEINPELLQQLLVALDQQRQPQEQQTMDKFATFDLPREILEDLDESSKKELQYNIQRYQKDAVKYDGGQWTKGGAINKVFTQDYKKYNVDSYQFISNKYKDADRLRTAARGGADIFQDLQALISRGGAGEEEISQIMEKARRLSVYAFASSKTIDNEAKTIATKALRLPGNLINLDDEEDDDDKEMAFSSEMVQQIQKARYDDRILRGSQSSNHSFRGGFNNGGARSGFRGRGGPFNNKGFFGGRGGFYPRNRGRGGYNDNHQSSPQQSNNPTTNQQ